MSDTTVVQIDVDLVPESGLYIANVRSLHPMIVKGYRLAELLGTIWEWLRAEDYFQRFPSDIVVDLHHRGVRERNQRLEAERLPFSIALARIIDVDHPAGAAATDRDLLLALRRAAKDVLTSPDAQALEQLRCAGEAAES